MPSSGSNKIIQELSRPSTLPLNPSIVPAISEWHIMMLALKLESLNLTKTKTFLSLTLN
jgi:hypothetical protein